jgi:hypothetical protein
MTKKKEESKKFIKNLPTNYYAATRPYCTKHHRAMLDIGGEKKCSACLEEQRERQGKA